MKKAKIGLIILALGLFVIIVYNQTQIITNKEEKISQVYNMLDDTRKHRVTDMKGAKIEKIKIRESNRRFTGVNKTYYGMTVYAVTFPINDGGPETEFIVLSNLELTEIVGYGVFE